METNGRRVVVVHEDREVTFVDASGLEIGTVEVSVTDGIVTLKQD